MELIPLVGKVLAVGVVALRSSLVGMAGTAVFSTVHRIELCPILFNLCHVFFNRDALRSSGLVLLSA